MPALNPDQRVIDVVDAIHKGEYRMPNIQRGYEWDQERVTKLLDSLMSGYPIGAVMVWRPVPDVYGDIPTRPFILDFDTNRDYLTEPLGGQDTNAYLVLDGQQRLQSLYLSFMGSYDGKRVYLSVDYVPSDEGDDTDYCFEFLNKAEADEQPAMVQLSTLMNLDVDTRYDFIEGLLERLVHDITDPSQREDIIKQKRKAINNNIERFRDRFALDKSLLVQEVGKNLNYDHVLEIFERVNRGGMVLSKSDLLFSTIKLKLADMESAFIHTIGDLNQSGRFDFNTDFIIKAALVIFDQRAKYDVAKLRNSEFVETLKVRFEDLHSCMLQISTWLEDSAKIKSSRFLKSQNALIPILDYMMLSGKHDKPDGENGRAMTEYLYMAFFRRLYSRAADAVLDQLHNRIVEAVKTDRHHFPIEAIRSYIEQRQYISYGLHDFYLNNSIDLMLNIADGGVIQRDITYKNMAWKELKLEVDHIFPRSTLSKRGMSDVVDHLGNYRLLGRPANLHKSDTMPSKGPDTDFFGRKDPQVEALYLAALDTVTPVSGPNREAFIAFRDARAALIHKAVFDFLGFTDDGLSIQE